MRTRLLPVCLALFAIVACGHEPNLDTQQTGASTDQNELGSNSGCHVQQPDPEVTLGLLRGGSPQALELAEMRLSFEAQYASLLLQAILDWPFDFAWQTVDEAGHPRLERRGLAQERDRGEPSSGCDAATARIFRFLLLEDDTQLAECMRANIYYRFGAVPTTKEMLEMEASMKMQCLMFQMHEIHCEGDCDPEP